MCSSNNVSRAPHRERGPLHPLPLLCNTKALKTEQVETSSPSIAPGRAEKKMDEKK